MPSAREAERSRRQASFRLRRPSPAKQAAPGMGLRLPAHVLARSNVSPFADFSGELRWGAGPSTAWAVLVPVQ